MRKHWLVLALSVNLVILGFFKYYGFFAASLNQALHRAGVEATAPVLDLVLPIGTSFYTFNSTSYTIGGSKARCRAIVTNSGCLRNGAP